jgi:hypothetical protein
VRAEFSIRACYFSRRMSYGMPVRKPTHSRYLSPSLFRPTYHWRPATQSNDNNHVKKRTKTRGENERVDVMNSAPDPSSGALRRRSTRVLQALPLIVRAVDALGRPFQDLALTETVNCHGCRYRAEHLALKNTSKTHGEVKLGSFPHSAFHPYFSAHEFH